MDDTLDQAVIYRMPDALEAVMARPAAALHE